MVERFNRTLLDMLATAARERPFDWESQLRRLGLVYNTECPPDDQRDAVLSVVRPSGAYAYAYAD